MGLDIAVFRGLVADPEAVLDENGLPDDDHFILDESARWSESCWPGRAADLEFGVIYRFADTWAFPAGSYDGYGNWRRRLASLVVDHPSAFEELIDFADNEGVIGPLVAAKLAEDFVKFWKKAREVDEDHFFELYRDWRYACEMAADHGAIVFL